MEKEALEALYSNAPLRRYGFQNDYSGSEYRI